MSKTRHFDHDHHIEINHSHNIQLKRINEFFKEIQYLVHSCNSEKEHDCKIMLRWIEQMHGHFFEESFNHITFSRFFDDLTRITGNHPYLKQQVLGYIKDHDTLRNDILSCTASLLLKAPARELCQLLGGISKLEIIPTEEYMSRWFSLSQNKVGSFTVKDVKQSIRSLARLHNMPPVSWLHEWYLRCDLLIDDIAAEDFEAFGKILCAFGSLHITPEHNWFTHFMKETRTYLTSLTKREDVFLLSKSFIIKDVSNETEFLSEWFAYSGDKIDPLNKQELHSLCVAFFYITKLDYEIPCVWVERCVLKLTNEFNSLLLNDISYALYAIALLQLDITSVRTFLEKCKHFFKRNNHALFSDIHFKDEFKNIMVAQSYLKAKGFYLEIDMNKYSWLVEKLKTRERNGSKAGEDYAYAILRELSIHTVEKEYWIDVIMDHVDFYLGSHMVIEYDGGCHYTNGHTNRLTALKTYLLQNYGYSVIRLDYRDNKEKHKEILLKNLHNI